MMSDVYHRLAKKFDELPQGYPATDSGIEIKILQKIFSPEDAEMALKLQPMPETAQQIAERLGKPVEEVTGILDEMAQKGQIASQTVSGNQVYTFIPYLPGLWEYQVIVADPVKDRELLEMFDEYYSVVIKNTAHSEPAGGRTVPINAKIEPGSQVQPYENVRQIIDKAKSFLVYDCQCRKERRILGKGCDHSIETCLNFSMEENAYDYFNLGGRVITKEEALNILDKVEEEGLVHNVVYNTKEDHIAICNCCPCCCVAMRGVKEFGVPSGIARSNFVAVIDQDTCTQCGVCADERCPVDAIVENDDRYEVLPDVCIGCGACTVTCPTESITLRLRPASEQDEPPDNMMDWLMKRVANRGTALNTD